MTKKKKNVSNPSEINKANIPMQKQKAGKQKQAVTAQEKHAEEGSISSVQEKHIEEKQIVSTQEMMAGADERTIIREQERLKKEAKRKKARKRRRIVAVALVACLLAGAGYIIWFRTKGATQEAETIKIVKTAAQQVVYAQITEINGNEITYKIAEKMEQQENADSEGDENIAETQQGQRGDQAGSSGRPGGFGGGEGMPDMSEMPGGFGGGEGMPDMSGMPGGFGGEGMPDMSGMFGGFSGGRGDSQNQSSQDKANTGMFVYDGATYLVGSEAVTTYIPVGTDVTTKLGTVTTFSRLAAKDCVAFVIEKVGEEEIIVAVYIVA